jgi:nondiscriminating glutamyl-tRNA synthetase
MDLATPFLSKAGYDVFDVNKTERLLFALKTYINKLDEIPKHAEIYYKKKLSFSPEQKTFLKLESSRKVVSLLNNKLKSLPDITIDNFKSLVNDIQKETGIKGKSLFQPIRLVLTGEDHGPELGLIAYVLGREEVNDRINNLHLY